MNLRTRDLGHWGASGDMLARKLQAGTFPVDGSANESSREQATGIESVGAYQEARDSLRQALAIYTEYPWTPSPSGRGPP